MKVKAYLDKRIIDNVINLIYNKSDIGWKLLQFITNCDELYSFQGMWEKDKKKSEIFYRLLGARGRSIHKITNEKLFEDIIKLAEHFSLSVTTGQTKPEIKTNTPLLTYDELIKYVSKSGQISFYIEDSYDFESAALIHRPTSIIINDNYFFNYAYPEEILSCILDNFIEPNFKGCSVITLFCKQASNETHSFDSRYGLESRSFNELVKDHKLNIEQDLKEKFPNADLVFEIFENSTHSINHDRFIFTDLLCYKSEKSFHCLVEDQSTVIHRYPIFEGVNFKSNVKYLTEFLLEHKIKDSQNGIIQSFLKRKEGTIV